MRYPDTVKIATTDTDGYGDETVTGLYEVRASFIKRAGTNRTNSSDGETSDAAVYLLPTDPRVLEIKDDLEGMYILAEPFGDSNWYRISDANVAERKLLDNAIDNVYCRLEKVAGMPYDNIS